MNENLEISWGVVNGQLGSYQVISRSKRLPILIHICTLAYYKHNMGNICVRGARKASELTTHTISVKTGDKKGAEANGKVSGSSCYFTVRLVWFHETNRL